MFVKRIHEQDEKKCTEIPTLRDKRTTNKMIDNSEEILLMEINCLLEVI